MFKGILLFIFYILAVTLIIPFGVIFFSSKIEVTPSNKEAFIYERESEQEVINSVEFNNNEIIQSNKESFETNKFEDYIVGVVAAEMPVSFEEEALKAQAIAARTYAFKRIDNINEDVDYKNIGQAYNSIEELKIKWGKSYENYYEKIKNAVYSTKGIIMIYEDEPIESVFHSTSAGRTEISENIWGRNLPYIKSVDSKADEKAPNFIFDKKIPNEKIIKEISGKYQNINKKEIISSFNISKRSDAGYVLEVSVGGKILTGREIRTMFELRSTNFTIKKEKGGILFTTKGFGHGAGMSQYGANFMALSGKNYKEILSHYYFEIDFKSIY